MHAPPVISDARGLVHPNACRSSVLKHMDQRSSFGQRSFENFSRGDSEKLEVGKRNWQRSSVIPFQNACIGLSPVIDATFGSINNRRSLGRHGYIGEGGRHRRDYAQLAESASLFGLPSAGRADLDHKYERNFFGETLADNPGGTCLVTDSRSHGKENSLLPATRLSSMQGKDATVAMDIDGSPLAVALPDAYSFCDSENKVRASCSQMSSPTLDKNHESTLPVDTGLSSGRAGFLRPGFMGEWTSCSTDLEAKLDRNQWIIQENATADSFPSKASDWKYQDKNSLGSISSLNSIDSKQVVGDGRLRFPGFLDSTLLSPSLISPRFLHLDTHCDESNNPSPRKRPRLGWGQGLAKYEKKKEVEYENFAQLAPFQEKNEADVEASEVRGVITTAAASSMDCNTCAEKNVSSNMNFSLNVMESKLGKDDLKLENMPVTCKQLSFESQSWQKMDLSPQMSHTRENGCWLECVHTPEKVFENKSEGYSYLLRDASLPKESILVNIEKLEFEIDCIEKELANVDFEIRLQDLTNLTSADIRHQAQGAVYPESVLASDPECVKFSNNLTTEACTSPLKAQCTLNTAQISSGVDPHVSDASTGIVQVEGDAPDQNMSFKKSGLSRKNLNVDVTMKSSESLSTEESPLLSTSSSQENGNLGFPNSCSISSLYQAIIKKNQEAADNAENVFSHLLSSLSMMGEKLYSSPEEAPKWLHNEEFHERAKEELKEQLGRHKKLLRFKEQVLVLKHQALNKIWRQEQFVVLQKKDRLKALRKCDSEHRNPFLSNNQRSSSRLRQLSSGVTKHDTLYDELPAVKKLLIQLPSVKRYLKMPAMIIDEKEQSYQRFVTRNALVEDPIAVEQERKSINPWTLEEKRVFLEKFATFNKNFAKIASYLPQKTVADCIEFYYQNRKSEDFEVFRRHQQLKKKKDLTRCNSYLATALRTDRFCESNAARVDALSLVASLASSDSFGDFPRSKRHSSSKLIDQTRAGPASDPVTIDGFGANEMKSASEILMSEAGIDSGCALALCSLSSVATADKMVYNGCFNNPSFTRRTNMRHLVKPNILRSVSIKNDARKVSRQEVDSHWTDGERQLFIDALKLYGKDLSSIALYVGTKTVEQCKRFFSKTRNRFGLDEVLKIHSLKGLADYGEDMGQSNPTSESVKGCINFNVATLATLLKDESLSIGAEAKTLDLKQMHSDVDNVLKTEKQTSFGMSEIQGDCAVGSNEKRLEHGVCDNNSGVVNVTQLMEFDVHSESKSTLLIENHVMSNGLTGSNLSCRMDANHLIETLSAVKGDVDAERLDVSALEVKKAKNDAPAVIESVRMDEGDFDSKVTFLGEMNMEDDVSWRCIDEELKDKDNKKMSDSKRDIDERDIDVVGTVGVVNSGKDILPSFLLGSPLAPSISSFASSNLLKKEMCTTAIVGADAKLRREPAFWTSEEKEKFVDIIRKHGKSWSILQKNLPLKSLAQIKTYFQNSKTKLGYKSFEPQLNKTVKVGPSKKRKVDDSDTSSNAGSVSQRSGSYFLEDGVFNISLPRVSLAASVGIETAMLNVGQTDQDLMDVKRSQITPQTNSSEFTSKVFMPTNQVPVSSSGTQIDLHMIPSGRGSQNFMPTSYSRFDSASDFSPKSYDCPEMYVPSQVFGSNLQNPEQVVHHTEKAKSLQQDPISQQQKQQELLAILQQQQHAIHQIQQHQKIEVTPQSPLLISQSTYSEQVQAARIQQLQQGSLISGFQHLEALQNKGPLFKQQHAQSLQSEIKHTQICDAGRFTTPYFTVIQNQSFSPQENNWEQIAYDKHKSVNQQVANHVLQQPSQQPKAQLWQHQKQVIHQKQQEQKMIELHLQQQRLQLQQQHPFKPSDKQMSQDHQPLMPLQHDHQILNNFQPNQPHPAQAIKNQQQSRQQQLLLQLRQATPVPYSGVIQETVEPLGSDLTDQQQREPRNSLTQSRSMFVETKPAQTPRGGDIKLFGQSLLSQPPSPAFQTGTASIVEQNPCHGNLQPPMNDVSASAVGESSKRFERQSVEVALSSTVGNTTVSSNLPTRAYTTAGDISMCNRAWIGLQINAGNAAVRDVHAGDGEISLSHREFCSLSKEDRIMAGKEHGNEDNSRRDALCIADRQAFLVPGERVGRVDSTPGNASSGSTGADHRFLMSSEGLFSSPAATHDDSISRNVGFSSRSTNTFPNLGSVLTPTSSSHHKYP